MKRKVISFCIIAALLFSSLLYASADNAIPKVVSAYWQNGILYSFATLPIDNPEEQKATLKINMQDYHVTKPISLITAEIPVHYMLLVDNSSSMADHTEAIRSLTRELLKTNVNARVTVAKFDRDFSVVKEDLTTVSSALQALGRITHQGNASDIGGSVADAICYLGEKGYADGEMTNLIVITDGEPSYSEDKQTEAALKSEAVQRAANAMAAYPEILVHTYSFREWDEALYSVLSNNKGKHLIRSSAKEAGKEIAAFCDSLYCVDFKLSDTGLLKGSLMLQIDMYYMSMGFVRNASVTPQISDVELPTDPSEPEESTAPPETEETTEPGETEETTDPTESAATESPSDPTDGSEETGDTTATDPTGDSKETGDTTATDPTGTTGEKREDPQIPGRLLLIACCAAAGLILAILIIIVSVSRKRPKAGSIRMRFAVAAGDQVRMKQDYYLVRELLIGSDKHCDVVLPNNTYKIASARIFMQGGMIYIEDRGSSDGVLVNGMRIFSANRLRSGDEITVGSVVLRVLF